MARLMSLSCEFPVVKNLRWFKHNDSQPQQLRSATCPRWGLQTPYDITVAVQRKQEAQVMIQLREADSSKKPGMAGLLEQLPDQSSPP